MKNKSVAKGIAWLVLAVGFALLCAAAFRGSPLQMPRSVKTAIDAVCTPAVVTLASFAALLLFFFAREFFAKPAVAWTIFNGALLFFGASLTDPSFFAAILRPDDLPIVAFVFLLSFFLWLAMYQAVANDRRLASPRRAPAAGWSGEGPRVQPVSSSSPRALREGPGVTACVPVEKDYAEKVLVWPDLVYPELISMIALSAVLIVWSLLVRAPLEQPANPALTPNPSKAP